jgi:EAL domain-containing protein (putative c-di-GMP-specific phosphodiesterase class I)
MAFQPIVDLTQRTVFSYEALVRGIRGEPASAVLGRVNAANQYSFDRACRLTAIQLAHALQVGTHLNINLLPNAVHDAESNLRTTLAAARSVGFPMDRIIFELTESEPVGDAVRLAATMREYRRLGLMTAIDDFGAGYAGLSLLAELQPDFIKLDISLIRQIETDAVRRVIVRGILSTCWDLKVEAIAEGVETEAEMHVLRDLGVRYFQGHLFAMPAFEALPAVQWPVENLQFATNDCTGSFPD